MSQSGSFANLKLINLKLVIEYDGKNYYGWQRQSENSGKRTIQHTIEKSLQVLFKGEEITVTGAGRTDAGVHAVNQTANVKIVESSLKRLGGIDKLRYSLNSMLPDDIVIKRITKAAGDFHARYSAKSRVYRYFFTQQKHAINYDRLFYIKTPFDVDKAESFCRAIKGIHSFKSLCKNKTDEHNFLCDVKKASVKKMRDGIIVFEIEASRFLHSMVRAIAGAMLKVSSGKMELNDFIKKFKKGEEIKLQYVPANALFLVKVNYKQ